MPQKGGPANLTSTEEQLEKWGISPDQEDYNSQLAMGSCSAPYCSPAVVISAVSTCLPSSNPCEIFIDQITGNIHTYDSSW